MRGRVKKKTKTKEFIDPYYIGGQPAPSSSSSSFVRSLSFSLSLSRSGSRSRFQKQYAEVFELFHGKHGFLIYILSSAYRARPQYPLPDGAQGFNHASLQPWHILTLPPKQNDHRDAEL